MLLAVERSGDPALAAYRDNILFRQTVTRYGAAWHHVEPWWLYFVNTIPAFWLPLSILLPWLVPVWLREARKGDRWTILLVGYVLLVLVFFSASPGKRGVYITPATPALALLSAPLLPLLLASTWPRRLWTWLPRIVAGAGVLAAIALLLVPKVQQRLAALELANPWPAALVLAVVSLTLVLRFRGAPLAALASVLGVVWLVVGFGVNPMLNGSRTPEAIMREAEARVPAGGALALVAWREQFILFARRPLSHFPYLMPADEQAVVAARWQPAGGERWVLGPEKVLEREFELSRASDLGTRHRQRWFLVPPGSSRPSGAVAEGPVFTYAPGAQAEP